MSKTAKGTAKQPTLIPQPNGRGALASGGYPGNKGGGDRSDALRRAFREDAEIAREKVMVLLEAGELTPIELITYIDKCVKYSIGKPLTRDELGGIIGRMWDVVVMHNDIEGPADRLTAIQHDWTHLNS